MIRRKISNDENGATSIEYGLIASLIAVVGIVAFTSLGGTISSSFTNIASGFCTSVGGEFAITESGDGSCDLD